MDTSTAFLIINILPTVIYCSKKYHSQLWYNIISYILKLRITILLIYYKYTIQDSFNTRSTSRYSKSKVV